jgi:hypothetical protein
VKNDRYQTLKKGGVSSERTALEDGNDLLHHFFKVVPKQLILYVLDNLGKTLRASCLRIFICRFHKKLVGYFENLLE